jgi:hypothetical protein
MRGAGTAARTARVEEPSRRHVDRRGDRRERAGSPERRCRTPQSARTTPGVQQTPKKGHLRQGTRIGCAGGVFLSARFSADLAGAHVTSLDEGPRGLDVHGAHRWWMISLANRLNSITAPLHGDAEATSRTGVTGELRGDRRALSRGDRFSVSDLVAVLVTERSIRSGPKRARRRHPAVEGRRSSASSQRPGSAFGRSKKGSVSSGGMRKPVGRVRPGRQTRTARTRAREGRGALGSRGWFPAGRDPVGPRASVIGSTCVAQADLRPIASALPPHLARLEFLRTWISRVRESARRSHPLHAVVGEPSARLAHAVTESDPENSFEGRRGSGKRAGIRSEISGRV